MLAMKNGHLFSIQYIHFYDTTFFECSVFDMNPLSLGKNGR